MKELAKAKIKAESEMSALVADAEANTGRFKYSYPTLDNVFHVIRGPLANNDLSLMQATVAMDGMIGIQSTLIHAKSGEVWEPFPLLMPASTNPQDNGKVLTYCRRYAIVAMFNLAVVDEDANTDARITYRQPPQSMNGVPEIAGGEPTDPFMNPDIEFSKEATALITKLRDLDKDSNKAMSAKQYQFMTGLVNGVVGEDKHTEVFATIFGRTVSSDALPGWKAKELIDWLNGSAEEKPEAKQQMAKKAIGEIAAKVTA